MSLRREIQLLAHDYVRKGGKKNRRKQAKRMIALGAFSETLGCRCMGELGKRHIIAFYKYHRHFSDAVLYQHYLAFRKLYELASKPNDPPAPFFDDRERSEPKA